VWLAIVGAIAAVVAAAYYLRLLASIWFSAPAAAPLQGYGPVIALTATAAAALSFPVLVLALGALQTWAEAAVRMSY
jgi:NADH-quinone oxidoreductase subunit N